METKSSSERKAIQRIYLAIGYGNIYDSHDADNDNLTLYIYVYVHCQVM